MHRHGAQVHVSMVAFFSLLCHIRKVNCNVSEEHTASVFRLTMFEENVQENGSKELSIYTGRIYTFD